MICVQFSQEGASTLHYRSRSLSFFSLSSAWGMTTGKGQNANLVMIFLCAYIFFISPFELSTRDRKKEKRDSPYISVSNKRSHMFRWAIALAADMGRLGPLLWYMSWPAIKGQPAAAAAPRWEKRSENLTDTNRSVSHMNIFQWPPHACSDGEDGRTWFVGSSPSGTWLGKRWVFFLVFLLWICVQIVIVTVIP